LSNLGRRFTGSDTTGLVRRAGPSCGHVPPPATTFLKPRWLGIHLLFWAITAAMVLLGRWQLTVSNEKHFSLQNFGYAFQWWAFSAFALYFWLRLIRDARHPPATAGREIPLAVRRGQPTDMVEPTYTGPADLISRTDRADQAPTVYRGYVIANSATSPARSDDDRYHAAYNDYLWELNLAATARRGRRSKPEESDVHPAPPRSLEPGTINGDVPQDR
jgi:hypothetical protein